MFDKELDEIMNPKGFNMLDKLQSELDDYKNKLLSEAKNQNKKLRTQFQENMLNIQTDMKDRNSQTIAALGQ